MNPQAPYNFTSNTLAELLGHKNSTVQRHAMKILKALMEVKAEEERKENILARNNIIIHQ